ncbi:MULTISPECIES: FAD-dependent thymidylate synthase [Anaerofustis]|uniref:FAD-dependent thymidylate synthase n=1 Tax=Anaerofustis TaxID=264995 RepID=UPI0011063CF0|nr:MULTISPECIES: FAD-dependent thymidylate synthase [Anaerofustis]MCO8194646.1 FAD-dependent thymidylate synthase [Anaerofustis sp. NSJ-163]
MKSNLKVSLVRYTPEPVKTVAMAAKLCYSKVGVEDISEKMSNEDAEKFVKMLMGFSHMSPLEHISFSFAIEGVSRTLTHQLVRHRIASYSQQSQRYVDENEFDYIIPPQIEKDEEALKVFEESMSMIQSSYEKLRDVLTKNVTKQIMDEDGLEESEARKKAVKLANEDARFVLPGACETKIITTMNARQLLHFFEERTCVRAQWEIRELATQMLKLVKEVCPVIFESAGPGCVKGGCPEGKMTCGKAKEIREKFKNL